MYYYFRTNIPYAHSYHRVHSDGLKEFKEKYPDAILISESEFNAALQYLIDKKKED